MRRTKRLDSIGFIVQARLSSERVPRKMLRPFAGSTLLDRALDTVKRAEMIPRNQFYLAVHEPELVAVGRRHDVQVFQRSERSAQGEDLLDIYEWHDRLPFEYIVLISACAPFLTANTIDRFVATYLASEGEGLFGVVEERNYFWNSDGTHMTKWPKGLRIMNTKFVEPTYRAAHCLYAGRRDLIQTGTWMGTFQAPGDPGLFVMDAFETFDIDHSWQFEMAESYLERARQPLLAS